MFFKEDLDRLRAFSTARNTVVSLYLDTDGRVSTRRQVESRLRDLIRLGKHRAELEPDREARREILAGLDLIEKGIIQGQKDFHMRGLAVFACHPEGFYHAISLPRPPRDRLFFGRSPWLRPLQFQEGEYHRFCTVLTDRVSARMFLVYQGAILEKWDFRDEVPPKAQGGERGGYEDKRAERKLNRKVGDHFRHVADTLFDLYKRDHFAWLIVGCRPEYIKEFESTLHPYLRSRLAAHIDIAENAPDHEVLERSLRVEKAVSFKEQCHGIDLFRDALKSGKSAVAGLADVLRHLNAQAVGTLHLSRDYSVRGTRCPVCPGLGTLELKCPLCGAAMLETPDVVTEAVDRALHLNCHVKQYYEGVGMDEFGNIGALVNFRV